ncbi:hypothetical protein [Rhizobium leguminosarum]|uniref:hypothetical protein n=1 Tax=Rhizobium leguminosarum TaxID=384 RepID=UPI003F94BB22
MARGGAVRDAPDAEAYVRDAELLREEIRERQRRKDCVKDVSLVRESYFDDHHLLNSVFFEDAGAGSGG